MSRFAKLEEISSIYKLLTIFYENSIIAKLYLEEPHGITKNTKKIKSNHIFICLFTYSSTYPLPHSLIQSFNAYFMYACYIPDTGITYTT